MNESSLRWMQDGETSKDVAEAMGKDLVEQLAQTALQTDGAQVAHAVLLQRILEQRHDHTRLPCSRES